MTRLSAADSHVTAQNTGARERPVACTGRQSRTVVAGGAARCPGEPMRRVGSRSARPRPDARQAPGDPRRRSRRPPPPFRNGWA